MRPAARIQAAIDVLDDMQKHHRPAAAALADWGKSHRFAGSGDRSAIGSHVYDALRRRASAVHRMGAETARCQVLGSLRHEASATDIAALFDGGQHAPPRLTAKEQAALERALDDASLPPAAAAELPEWLLEKFTPVFGERTAVEGRALAERAPVDLRANTLKGDRDQLAVKLDRFAPATTRWSALGLRLPAPESGKRQVNVEAEISHGQGLFEIQDEGSQIAAALVGARPGESVLDLCAGAGGKTLALAAAMQNRGRILAYDDDKVRLRPIFERLTRAGVTCVEPIAAADKAGLVTRGATFDRVLVDAPCSGSGTWRRKPDAKWRLRPKSLETRRSEQRAVLGEAAGFVRPGGHLVYVTCSVLHEENGAQIDLFLAGNPDFALLSSADAWANASPGSLNATVADSAAANAHGLLLTPARHGTDGFFVAVLVRRPV